MNKKIIYIAGAGRSGSTLLDISLGNMDDCFSLGELIYFVENGILKNEYCSCGSRVRDCSFWGVIVFKWNKERKLSNKLFIDVQHKLLRNKRFLINLFTKPAHYKDYIHDVKKLYDIIFKESDHNTIIDSSKNGNYIKILKKLNQEFEVVHLKRRFLDRYKSTRKHLQFNPSKGIEREVKPMNFYYSFLTWFSDNFTVWFHSAGIKITRVYYHDLILNPTREISKIIDTKDNEKELLKNRGPLFANHLVAGSRFRMHNKLFINKK